MAFEFEKKFYVNRGSFDCSPVSMRALLLCRSTLGLATIRSTYHARNRALLRLGGAGFRVMARLKPLRLSGRWERLLIFLSYSPNFTPLAFEFWINRKTSYPFYF